MIRMTFAVALMVLFCACQAPLRESAIEEFTVRSEIFQNERRVRIYLPPGYQDRRHFKTLYLLDGQNVFGDPDLSPSADWRVDEIADSLIKAKLLEPLVIVAIDNIGGKYRGKEYLPWADVYLHPPIDDPQGIRFPEFLTKEVMPLIESRYHVSRESKDKGIGGFSYGGLISAYTMITQSESFGFALVESPSFYVNDQKILDLAAYSEGNFPAKIYMGVGTNEIGLEDCGRDNDDNLMAVNDVLEMEKIIRTRSPSTKILVQVEDCASHSFSEAAERLPTALIFLLNQTGSPNQVK